MKLDFTGEHKLAKKQGLMWKSRVSIFQSTSWKSGKAKAGFVGRGGNKLDSMPRDLGRAKAKFRFLRCRERKYWAIKANPDKRV